MLSARTKDFWQYTPSWAEPSRAEHAAKRTPSRTRTTQAARFKSAIAKQVLRTPKMAVALLHLNGCFSRLLILNLRGKLERSYFRNLHKSRRTQRNKKCSWHELREIHGNSESARPLILTGLIRFLPRGLAHFLRSKVNVHSKLLLISVNAHKFAH